MPRLTISLPDKLHQKIASLAVVQDDSMSNIVNDLLVTGLMSRFENKSTISPVEQHCQQLIIQMNALIKNMSASLLKFNQDDFEKLQQAAVGKYLELKNLQDEVVRS